MRHQIVGLNYGCEVTPVLEMLRVTFPEIAFTDERIIGSSWPTGLVGKHTSSWAVFATGEFNAKELDHMRVIGAAYRDGFQKGFMAGWNDHAKHGG